MTGLGERLAGHPEAAARALAGAVLEIPAEGLRAVITEVEAYGGPPESPWPDPGAHTWPGPTDRNRVMFGPAGRLYVYRSYGLHRCANVTCGPEGVGGGVLLRSVRLLAGREAALRRRGLDADAPPARLRRATLGPGNVAAALGIDLADYGTDLLHPDSRIRLRPAGAPVELIAGPRVGLRRASARPWRLRVAGERVSGYRAHPLADGLE
ncbi:DNA-3-methyladenine glycosylase [Corynebacterium sphenisci]|uniref:DNA-3-methyladenine glycosylase n=1 Tax=Corynebacterium sphenisci TaxID=191493 RepID=UPI001B806070|nr:DNA-3-methyladenine glycosylase [Corynebacterium sphenisci]